MTLPDWIAWNACVLSEGDYAASWSAGELARRVGAYSAGMLGCVGAGAVIGLLADNSPEWIAIDLAAQRAEISLVPLPAFFSSQQMEHAVRASGMHALFCGDAERAAALGFGDAVFAAERLCLYRSPGVQPCTRVPAREARKITFTSGTTQAPKGVLLSTEQQLQTARALASALASLGVQRHLCALPLSVLLENVAGVYTALMLGASCVCPPLEDLGVTGASAFDPERCLQAIGRYQPDTLMLLPQMLHSLVVRLSGHPEIDPRIRSLKFVAVGGAKTPAPLITAARRAGLPVYEGYGLTECGSVVSVNVPGADRIGTVGKPLPGVTVRLAADGEIEIAGRSHAGYVGSPAHASGPWFRSGDLGAIDGEGFVSITGRKKNVLVTSFGRNVSPEWPESLLLESPLLAQAAVFGDACPHLVAILVPVSPHIHEAALDELVRAVNGALPEYARVRAWIRADEPFAVSNGLATPNGRVRRDAVFLHYEDRLSAIYEHRQGPRPSVRALRAKP